MAQNKQLRELYAVRDSYYFQLNEIYAVAVSTKADTGLRLMFQVRHEQLRNIYDQIIKVHSDVVTRVANTTEQNLEIEHDFLRKVDQTYFSVEIIFRELFPPAQSPVTNQSTLNVLSTPPSTTRLPKRNLRIFDGKLEDWMSFIQVFSHSIHDNATLANVEKFEYLLGRLSGEPLNLIKAISLSDDNYPIAYKALYDRYDNKRDLATHYWNRLHSLSKLRDESASGLRNLYNNFKENLAALRALKIDDSLEDFILLNLLLEKVDQNMRRLFEAEIRELKGDIPSFNRLSDFVESQCRVLASEQPLTTASSKPSSSIACHKPVSSLVASSSPQNSNNCYVCEKNHFVYVCPLLKSKSPDDRYKLVKDRKLCVNCLRPHQIRNCPSKSTCRTCNKPRHSMLHFATSPFTNSPVPSINNDSTEEGRTVPTVNVSCVNAFSTSVAPQVALLSTALVDIRDSQGRTHTLRAILDSGSEASFITAKYARIQTYEEIAIKSKYRVLG
ncbi:hypothetical protein NQ314_002239 [Rhamnusium bicolor]|uniref:Peptidase aspartic putative domain-containing protein n=1 Tax=Rhamnusium bicolor TaxID=1586634 RepID=A0AAV8ZS50_9CUCU|nr:hypothetical protein NQ314_002239 [Rhamnusium bicolor]